MRGRIGTGAVALWGFALNVALTKGWLNWCPDWGVALLLGIPLIIWVGLGLTHDRLRNYLRRTKRSVAILVFILGGALIGGGAGGVLYALLTRPVAVSPPISNTENPPKDAPLAPSSTSTPAPDLSKQVADLVEEVKQLREAIVQNPSVDYAAKVAILQAEYDRLAKKREELTKQDKDALDNQNLTLRSLEEGRKRYAEATEIEKRQQENTTQRQVIEQQQAAQRNEELEKKFANRYAPIVDYVIATLHKQLSTIAKQPSEQISTDFQENPPSIYNSTFLKDGKFQKGGHFVHIGSHKEWEFIITGPGENIAEPIARRYFQCQISAGRRDPMHRSTDWYSIMTVSSEATPVTTEPVKLNVQCFERHGAFFQRELYSKSCTESEYQKPIQAAIDALIRDRYNAFQLGKTASPTPPSSTPGKEASPH